MRLRFIGDGSTVVMGTAIYQQETIDVPDYLGAHLMQARPGDFEQMSDPVATQEGSELPTESGVIESPVIPLEAPNPFAEPEQEQRAPARRARRGQG